MNEELRDKNGVHLSNALDEVNFKLTPMHETFQITKEMIAEANAMKTGPTEPMPRVRSDIPTELDYRAEEINARIDELERKIAPAKPEPPPIEVVRSLWTVWAAFAAGILLTLAVAAWVIWMYRPATPDPVAADPISVEEEQLYSTMNNQQQLIKRIDQLEKRLEYVRVEQLRVDTDSNTRALDNLLNR